MACAVRAYENAVLRPYNLEEDIVRRDHPAIDYSSDQFRELMDRTGRIVYNKGDDWTLPTALRTKDKMCFAWACTLLHEATGEARYLNSAIEYADAVCERQCLDPAGVIHVETSLEDIKSNLLPRQEFYNSQSRGSTSLDFFHFCGGAFYYE